MATTREYQTPPDGRPAYRTSPGPLREDPGIMSCGLLPTSALGVGIEPQRTHAMPQGTTEGPEVYYWALLSDTFRPCCYRALPPRENDKPPLRLESSECRWCGSGKREPRHHLFTDCLALLPQIQKLWGRVGKDCGWKHPRAPAVKKLWKEYATEVVLEFLEDTPVGRWPSAGVARAPREEGTSEGAGSEGEEGGPGPL